MKLKAVGVSFEPAKSNLKAIALKYERPILDLKHVTSNPHDSIAISIQCDGLHIGWIPKPFNSEILLMGLHRVSVTFDGWNRYDGNVVGLMVNLEEL